MFSFSQSVMSSQDPNSVVIRRDKKNAKFLDKYKVKNRDVHIYRAAVILWGGGGHQMTWERALELSRSAFEATSD